MANRAKQATLALNLFAIALVGLLYNVDRADDHRMDQQMSQEMTKKKVNSSTSCDNAAPIRHRYQYVECQFATTTTSGSANDIS